MIIFLRTMWAILVETFAHPLSTSVIRVRDDRVSRTGPDDMRVVGYRKVAEHVYEVTTESARYGRVVRNVLVLPESAMGPPVSGCDCGDR